ncbi:M81 family metallopeptidase [Pseudaminobacter sp. 19-2017]|uniref:Microcystinase C n=1 Tax=Pseudaminobacter soli (ex Zhang et al. 2022) TaxID=2831468 RepID=A0A942DWU2_9HYPH|nr:M81 family metallopeptidase [Pseudaminobacter soli]MBS3649344.1 M81 family metallopeptidase [Pseudaminobacter soli]
MRIALGGFQHETNTFVPETTGWVDFNTAGGWPPLTLGAAIIDTMAGRNLPAAGMIDEAMAQGIALEPLVWCQAEPGGMVELAAYERILQLFLEAIVDKGPFDAILLDLHGAMVVDGIGDGEGDFLRRFREAVGPEVMIAASLDLHANVSQAMVDNSDFMSAYRTYPHVDMAETGRRVARVLFDMLRTNKRLGKALVQLPYLIPIPAQCTLSEPTRTIYERLEGLERDHGVQLSFSPGFPPSDTADCGPTVIAYGAGTHHDAERLAHLLAEHVLQAEKAYSDDEVLDDRAGVMLAMSLAETATRPIILVDTQDNPGAGGSGDTTGLVKRLLECKAKGAVVAVLFDPTAAMLAHEHGMGARFDAEVGGRNGPAGVAPLKETFEVVALADGEFQGTGGFYAGATVDFGRLALLRIVDSDVAIVVGSRRSQAGTQAIFRHLGIDPGAQKIIGLKSSVHFRADFQSIAERILVVKSPGYNTADPSELPYRRIRKGIRLRPTASL